MRSIAISFCVLATLSATDLRADDVSADLACKLHHAVIDVDAFAKLPAPIVNFVLARTGEMAERGQFFNATDAVQKPAPAHRFIRAGHEGDRWFVWFERGGIAYIKNIAVFELMPGQTQPRLMTRVVYFRENPCVLTDAVLNARSASPAVGPGWW